MSAVAETTYHFPNAEVMTRYLSEHQLLNSDYNREKGITEAVAKLAAARFADSEKVGLGIKMGVQLMINDLQNGVDGFAGEQITKLDGYPPQFWMVFAMNLEQALIDCANKAS